MSRADTPHGQVRGRPVWALPGTKRERASGGAPSFVLALHVNPLPLTSEPLVVVAAWLQELEEVGGLDELEKEHARIGRTI